jgi:hypothetical protein
MPVIFAFNVGTGSRADDNSANEREMIAGRIRLIDVLNQHFDRATGGQKMTGKLESVRVTS